MVVIAFAILLLPIHVHLLVGLTVGPLEQDYPWYEVSAARQERFASYCYRATHVDVINVFLRFNGFLFFRCFLFKKKTLSNAKYKYVKIRRKIFLEDDLGMIFIDFGLLRSLYCKISYLLAEEH